MGDAQQTRLCLSPDGSAWLSVKPLDKWAILVLFGPYDVGANGQRLPPLPVLRRLPPATFLHIFSLAFLFKPALLLLITWSGVKLLLGVLYMQVAWAPLKSWILFNLVVIPMRGRVWLFPVFQRLAALWNKDRSEWQKGAGAIMRKWDLELHACAELPPETLRHWLIVYYFSLTVTYIALTLCHLMHLNFITTLWQGSIPILQMKTKKQKS